MNERIKELIRQARLELLSTNPYTGVNECVGLRLDGEKLAELIVKECMSFILDSLEAANVNLTSKPNDDYWLGFRHACDDHLTDIREHFGVK